MTKIALINKTVRSYNGIKPNEVTEINKENLDSYLEFGFEYLSTEALVWKAPEIQTWLTKEEIIEKLKEKGIEIPKKANKEQLQKLLDDSVIDSNTGGNEGIENYKKLLTENVIEFSTEATEEELKTLCTENGLI